MLQGGLIADLPDWLVDADRLYRLVKLTGWTPEQIAEAPGIVLDELLAVDQAHREAAAGG